MNKAVVWLLILVAFFGMVVAILWPTKGSLHATVSDEERAAILKAYFYEMPYGWVVKPAYGAEINGTFQPNEATIRILSPARIKVYTAPHDLVVYSVNPDKLFGARSAFDMKEAYVDGQPVKSEDLQP